MNWLKENKIVIKLILSFGLIASIGGLIGIAGLYTIQHIINLNGQASSVKEIEDFTSNARYIIIGLMLTGTAIATLSGVLIVKRFKNL